LLPTVSKPSQREAELSTCTFSELYDFLGEFYQKVDCKLLISGNTSKDEASRWVETSLANQLVMEKVDVPDWDVVQLDPRTAAVWLQPAIDNTQSNSAIEIYFQLPGRDSWAWNKDIASRCIPSQNMSKHVKTCQNMSRHVKTCQTTSKHVKRPKEDVQRCQSREM